MLIASAVLIFTRLGHYPLWDDEAITAMTARGVWRTGDTSARVDDHNILAYRNGLLLNHFKDRFTPPLQFYLLAPFIGWLGETSLICRLPFAVCGLLTVGILLLWLWRSRPPPLVWWAAAVILLTNAEFFLFQRQCRYYALATTLTILIGYLYCHLDPRRRSIMWLALALIALLLAQYLNYAAAVGCLVADYVIWGRKRRRLSPGDWAVLIVPQLIVGGIVCAVWNAGMRLGIDSAEASRHILLPRLQLLWWNWRDMIACDFVIVPLLVICPFLYFSRKSNGLLRAPVALFVYLLIIALCAASPVTAGGKAEIRYLAPVLPLCIGIAILAVWAMASWNLLAKGVTLTVVAALSILLEPVLNGTWSVYGSTALPFYHELYRPQQEPYTPVIQWINAHVAAGKSVYVQPDYMCYPLMFHASKAVYAWQLTDPPKPEFAGLPAIHFQYRGVPDYMIAFGPWNKEIKEAQTALAPRGVRYKPIDTIKVYWKDQYRPERIWRSFVTVPPKAGEEIYIYQQVDRR